MHKGTMTGENVHVPEPESRPVRQSEEGFRGGDTCERYEAQKTGVGNSSQEYFRGMNRQPDQQWLEHECSHVCERMFTCMCVYVSSDKKFPETKKRQ